MQPRAPKYRKCPNGQAFVEHCSIPNKSRRCYLGKYGSEESHKRYAEIVQQILSGGFIPKHATCESDDVTVDELILDYLEFAETYYYKDGKPSKEFANMSRTLVLLSELCGSDPAAKFGPRALEAFQKHLIRLDFARTQVNYTVRRVKRFFRWCCKQERINPESYHRLDCVDGLRRGRCNARESKPVRPVARQWVDVTLPFVALEIQAMIELQYLCGMRPGEVCIMRGCDIDTSGPVWLYTPSEHKNAWRSKPLVKAIPRSAQAVLAPFLDVDPNLYLFSPANAEARRNEVRRRNRKTPLTPSQAKRKAKASPKRAKKDHYTACSYRRTIEYGVNAANRARLKAAEKENIPLDQVELVPNWHPNQLRHAIATEISQTLGQQAAQRWLGHADLNTTSIYAEAEVSELIAIAQQLDRRWAG